MNRRADPEMEAIALAFAEEFGEDGFALGFVAGERPIDGEWIVEVSEGKPYVRATLTWSGVVNERERMGGYGFFPRTAFRRVAKRTRDELEYRVASTADPIFDRLATALEAERISPSLGRPFTIGSFECHGDVYVGFIAEFVGRTYRRWLTPEAIENGEVLVEAVAREAARELGIR